jgi:hypothetical protein
VPASSLFIQISPGNNWEFRTGGLVDPATIQGQINIFNADFSFSRQPRGQFPQDSFFLLSKEQIIVRC